MARKVSVILVSDLSGTESDDVETVGFAIDGSAYEIDLTAKEAEKLRHSLGEFIDNARRAGRAPKASTAAPKNTTKVGSDAKAIRAWAASNNVNVPPRGRIPVEVREQYEAAISGKAAPAAEAKKEEKGDDPLDDIKPEFKGA